MGGLFLVLALLPVAWVGGTILNRLLEHLETWPSQQNDLHEYGRALGLGSERRVRHDGELDDDRNRGSTIGRFT